MDFAYTTEQENLRQEVQAFISENVTEEIRTEIEQFGSRQNRGSLTSGLYKKISDMGIFFSLCNSKLAFACQTDNFS